MTDFTRIIRPAVSALAIGLMGISSMHAIVAKPGLIEAAQPDGSRVTIRLEGGPRSHRAFSSDGYLLTTDAEGFYVFADCGADGLPVATHIKVADPEKRSPEVAKAVSMLNTVKITEAFNRLDAIKEKKEERGPLKGPGLFTTHFPSKGEQRAAVILVNFSDNQFSMEDPNDYFTRQLNEPGFSDNGGTGSVRDYYLKNSSELFQPIFDVYGPVTLDNPGKYYGRNDMNGDKRPYQMIIDACEKLDDEIDFSQYDRNEDGEIDNVYVYYAGYGEADGGDSNTIWPHSHNMLKADPGVEHIFDGVLLNHYACSNELDFKTNLPTGIGTITHEFTHVLGLPDLYATGYTTAFTCNDWDLLCHGSYNNNSRTPPYLSSFERYALDWMEPEVISEDGNYTLDLLSATNKAYIVRTENDFEYFLLENRQLEGNDLYNPGHGMLVWHVDFDQYVWDQNTVNNDAEHQYVDLVEADNILDYETCDGDPFPGAAGVTSFGAATTPALVSWYGVSPGFDIVDIEESPNGIITFTVKRSASGIEGIEGSGKPVSSAYYDLSGREVTNPANGVYVRIDKYADGSTKTVKTLVNK